MADKVSKKSRRGYRSQITAEFNRIKEMLDGSVEKDIAVMKRVKTKVEKYLATVAELDTQITEQLPTEEEIDQEIEAQQNYRSRTLEELLVLEEAIANSQVGIGESNQPQSGVSVNEPSARLAKVKLPKIEIPIFRGDYLEWQGFWDIYAATVHDDVSLSKVQKFSYLLGCLGDEALDMVQGYQLTEANYDEVIGVLTERYGDKQRAKFGHFEALVAIKPASLASGDLVRMYYECERHIRSLVALGMSETEFTIAFVPIILQKLPVEVKREVWATNGGDEWTMSNLRKYLKAAITARERSESGDPAKNGDHGGNGKKTYPKQGIKGSASMLVAPSKNKSKKEKQRKCRFCGQSHFADQCQKYSTADARKTFLRENGFCYSCLDDGHRTDSCPNSRACYYCNRKGHHRSLCFDQFGRPTATGGKPRGKTQSNDVLLNPNAQTFVPNAQSPPTTTAVALAKGEVKGDTEVSFLQTAVVTFTNENKDRQEVGRALMDTASSKCHIREELSDRLNLPVVEESYVSVGRFGSNKRTTVRSKRVRLDVVCRDGTVIPIIANVVKVISAPICRHPINTDQYPLLSQLPLAEPLNTVPDELPIDVLIGSDYYYQFVKPESVIHCENGPILVGSKLGFLTAGTMRVEDSDNLESTLVLLLTESSPGRSGDPYDQFSIERFWQMEDVGTKVKQREAELSDEEALQTFYDTLKFEDGRYWVTWPWKSSKPDLADNRKLAFARLKQTFTQLAKNPDLLKSYDEIIQNQFQKGVVEIAPEQPSGPVYYIPHHAVLKPERTTTKIRVVYDASSKARKTDLSLNDCIHRGLVILDDLCGLIMRSRTHKIGIVADIEKAFLQIGLQDTERDVTRFFWFKDISKPPTPDNIVVFRFTRVCFGTIASPSLLAATLDAHARKVENETKDPVVKALAHQFRTNRYSDNILLGADSVDTAVRYCQEAKTLCQGAAMNLREYYTNEARVLAALDEPDRGKATVPKILGVRWNLESDTLSCFGLKDKGPSLSNVPTKREIVREVAQVFDPCGWFSPVTVAGKMLIQEIWKLEIPWDDAVIPELERRWEKIRKELQKIPSVELQRYTGCCEDSKYQLHAFCDASQKATAAAVYLRQETSERITADLVFAKSRLAPLDPMQSIPRLELTAMESGANLLEFVEKELRLPISKRLLWSDSQCSLQWLRKARLTTQFVQNRVNSILSHRNVKHRYVGTSENPADLPTRGCDVETLKNSRLWWHGPSWLTKNESEWPKDPWSTTEIVLDQTEVVAVNVEASEELRPLILDPEKFSNLFKLFRITAYVIRAQENFQLPVEYRNVGVLRVEEIAKARLYWDRHVQEQAFPEARKKVTPGWLKRSKLRGLNVYKDSKGLLRCRGRLGRSELSRDVKDPVLLPKNNPYTMLVIRHAHEHVGHAGTPETLAEIRQTYWIIHGKSQCNKVLRECRVCRRVEGGPYRVPSMPELPEIRVTEKYPFAYTGLDYLGPLLVKPNPDSDQTQKMWICLFTCALIRAVHLEVVENQTADEFHLALRRFFALYGTPLTIVSDNASQFLTVEKAMTLMSRATQSEEEIVTNYNVEWRKIPEMAPWMGGFYERMVGTVKRFLKKALDGVCVHSSELRTVIAEITYVVNSRPLLYVGSDLNSFSLCPRDFLGKACRSSFPNYEELNTPVPRSTVGTVVANWRRVQSLSTKFWEMWKKGYLTSLREKYANAAQRNPSALEPTLNSVVQVKDKLPRGQWRLGKIEKLIPSRDGKIRSVVLRLANGRSITRPIKLLYPLEMGSSDGTRPFDPVTDENDSDQENESIFEGFSQNAIERAQEQYAEFIDIYDADRLDESVVGGGN